MSEIPTLEATPQAHVHLIGGEKGGVGKSLVSRLLAQYFIDHDIPFIGFDTDRSHGSLMRFYAGYASPVLVDRYEALDTIIESSIDQPRRRVLVDLAAQTHDPLVKWMDESGVLDLADVSGLAIHYWHVMDSGRDSVDLLKKLLDRFGHRLSYVLVRNQLRGDDFTQLEHPARWSVRWPWAPRWSTSVGCTTRWCRRSTRPTAASGQRRTRPTATAPSSG